MSLDHSNEHGALALEEGKLPTILSDVGPQGMSYALYRIAEMRKATSTL